MWFFYAMLGNVIWSISDVTVSIIMNKVERSPTAVGWVFCLVHICLLLLYYLVAPVETTWVFIFAFTAILSYVASLCFLVLVQEIDISVSSVSWVFMSLGVAAGGVLIFGDTWTIAQALGAALSVTGALLLALWHKRVDRLRTFLLILGSGLLYVPSFLVQKAAYIQGISVYTVFFWDLLFFDTYAFIVPLLHRNSRLKIRALLANFPRDLLSLVFIWVCMSMLAFFAVAKAYQVGDASLVGIAENGQPFFLMIFAAIATYIAPKYAPKELLSTQSVRIKTLSFCTVFIGLALLAG